VSFIDSVGLSVILALYRRCRDDEGALTIMSPSPAMRRTLDVAGLIDLLNVV
jgi:anti-anti-sigma factor